MAATQKQKANLIPAKKGEVRNPKGAPKKLPALDLIIAEVLGQETGGLTAAQQILNALKAKAKKGDVKAAELILNRAYGKPKENIESKNEHVIKVVYGNRLKPASQEPGEDIR